MSNNHVYISVLEAIEDTFPKLGYLYKQTEQASSCVYLIEYNIQVNALLNLVRGLCIGAMEQNKDD